MKRQFTKRSALTIADEELVKAVGKAMIVFAATEGAVNFALSFLIENHIVWTQIADTGIARRLKLLGQLLGQSSALDKKEINAVVAHAKKLFQSRNLIAHNPLITGGGSQETRIHKLGGGTKNELSAVQISQITDEADQVYDQIWQLFLNYQMASFEAEAPS